MIVGGGCRGRRLAGELLAAGHAVRISTRTEAGREAIESVGAECWIGDPDRLATLRGALDSVTIVCWLLGTASGSEDQLGELFGPRLELFVTQAIDTTVRGFVYEAGGSAALEDLRGGGERTVRAMAERNSIPVAFLGADPGDHEAWQAEASAAIELLLSGR